MLKENEDVIKFKDIIKTIDIAKYSHSQREFCEIVDTIYAEVFNNKKEVNNEKEDKQDRWSKKTSVEK